MCLAIPMKINEVKNDIAICEAGGVFRDVNLLLLAGDTIKAGDFILVHLGYAIQKVSAPDALTSWDTYDAMQVAKDIAQGTKPSSSGGQHA